MKSPEQHPLWNDVWTCIDNKTKPRRSLGRLEHLAARLAIVQETLKPTLDTARVVVFGADHGVTDEGVSAFPKVVTREMMRNFARGGAAVTVLGRSCDVQVEVVDVGVDADLSELGGAIVHAKVCSGSRNMTKEAAMSEEEFAQALEAGRAAARRAHAAGVKALGLGEMGIGNTTAASAILSALTGVSAERTVGPGTGVAADQMRHKRKVIETALALHAGVGREPLQVLRCLGGLELAAMAGCAHEAARLGLAVVVDGFIVTCSILAAVRAYPELAGSLFYAHRSQEPGHVLALTELAAEPILDLGMRLGEGSGAVLAMPILRAAAAMLREMASFAEAGVSEETN
jgi:nicotinate-nucleotide--dimethylbenzimidazole phosphoribosyltransferase